MKTITYEGSLKVNCPVCKQVIMDDDAEVYLKSCEHLKLWHNKAMGETIYADPSFSDVAALMETENEEEILAEHGKGMTVQKYDGGYLGGCQNAIDYVIFSK